MFYLETEYRDWETNPEMQRHRLHCQQFRKRLDWLVCCIIYADWVIWL